MFQLFLIKETVNIRKIFVDLNCEMIKSILVWTIKESLSLIRLKEKKENREEKKASCHKEGFLSFLFSDVVGAAIE
jgi:hypothetical protein